MYNRLSNNKTTIKDKDTDVKVKQGTECGSDHCLVTAKVYNPFINKIKGNIEKDDVNLNKINDERYNIVVCTMTVPCTCTEEDFKKNKKLKLQLRKNMNIQKTV
jgi:hypothetical protein